MAYEMAEAKVSTLSGLQKRCLKPEVLGMGALIFFKCAFSLRDGLITRS